jgi:hypothetical protein
MNRYKAMVYAKSPRTGIETNYLVGYVVAPNIEEAIRVYEEDGMPWVTVEVDVGLDVELVDLLKDLKEKEKPESRGNPREVMGSMDYDSFMDCLESLGSKEEIETLIEEYTKEGESMAPWVKVMKQFLKDNYGDKGDEKTD